MKTKAKNEIVRENSFALSLTLAEERILVSYVKIKTGATMDTSNPAVFVNAELLRIHVGKRVRAVIQVLRSDGGTVAGKSTDEQQIFVKGNPSAPLSTFVEVIGIADTNQSIRAEIWSNFGDAYDTQAYNQICVYANGEYKHLFI